MGITLINFRLQKNITVTKAVIQYFKNYFHLLRRFITENLQLKQELHEFPVKPMKLLFLSVLSFE